MNPSLNRRQLLSLAATGALASCAPAAATPSPRTRDLRIKKINVTPIALPDPPILAASGCHGPYFLRTIIEIETDEGVTGIGETYGSRDTLRGCEKMRDRVVGSSAFAYRALQKGLRDERTSVYAALEMACLDAAGKATKRRACELLGGPVREEVEFAAYLFYRYAADHPKVLTDERLVDDRGKGDKALDAWGDVRSAESMADMAEGFRKKWGFRILKLKAGVLTPKEELKTLRLMHERFGDDVPLRIDPNGRWKVETANRVGRAMKNLPIEYYEDPVRGQEAMAAVGKATGLPMATNSCVSRWSHMKSAVAIKPVDVVLGDIYWFGGITGIQALGRTCKSLGWGLGYHSNNHSGVTMAAMIHGGAATPEFTHALDTHYVWLVEGEDVIEGRNLPIKDGKMLVPPGPGLGVTLDRDRLARAHERYEKCGMRNRNDSDTMRMFQPGWKRALY